MPEMSIKQALEYGVSAHRAGNYLEAGRYYSAILSVQPNNSIANHNMGMLELNRKNLESAVSFFEKSVKSSNNVLQFWKSFIEALLQLGRVDSAKQALEKARKKALKKEDIATLEQLFSESSPARVTGTEPEMEILNELVTLYRTKSITELINKAHNHLNMYPNSINLQNLLAIAYLENGSYSKAIKLFKSVLKLNPNFADAYYNLGIAYEKTKEYAAAITHYKQAVKINDKYFEAFNNLGNVYKQSSDYKRAVECYQKAISVKPDYAEAFNNLANAFRKIGEFNLAIDNYVQAIEINKDYREPLYNLSHTLKNRIFKKPLPKLESILLQILEAKTITRSSDISPAVISLLKMQDRLKDYISLDITQELNFSSVVVARDLSENRLLLRLMTSGPIADADLENLFTRIRFGLLKSVLGGDNTDGCLAFISTLAVHNYINEYVHSISSEEKVLLQKLKEIIEKQHFNGKRPKEKEVLILATYEPLRSFSWIEKHDYEIAMEEVYRAQVREPLTEGAIRSQVVKIGDFTDRVTKNVQAQYEESPYPRWVDLRLYYKPYSINDLIQDLNLQLKVPEIRNEKQPNILIAGCGTGRHPIETSSRYADSKVVALDLSSNSLSYAIRKSQELNVSNIEFFQGDILNIDNLNQNFDIIESVGVLHHMMHPLEGWSMLCEKLKTGGLMKIGLYSELARRDITKIRQEIKDLKITPEIENIREYRSRIKSSSEPHHRKVVDFADFYTLSEFRDLVFHVQEHCFTIEQIQESLKKLGLVFCGFESDAIISSFKLVNPEPGSIYDLKLWSDFEAKNPNTFAGMYQFWCQKV